jgi:4-hydroxy-3-methylbut-2-enyl diphosphate reductase
MNLAFASLERRRGPVYSHGPLIHNRQALELLEMKGLRTWPQSPEAQVALVAGPKRPTVIIRAHGLAPEAEAELRALGVEVVDATCPRVAKVQRLVAAEAAGGRDVVIWGSAGHPEVDGLLGYARGRGRVAASPAEVAALPELEAPLLVAQTTQDRESWPVMVEAVQGRWPGARAVDTICLATVKRQQEVRRLAGECQALVVVGGRDSGNTRRLCELGRAANLPTAAVEGPEELDEAFFKGLKSVGLAAGASTPSWQIRAVRQRLEAMGRSFGGSPASFVRRLFRALALSNIYVGLGAGCLGLALARAVGYQAPDFFFGLFFFYVQAMHLLHGFLDRDSARYNDPDRAQFLTKYRPWLTLNGLASLALSLSAAALAGPFTLLLLVFLSFCGLIYAAPIPIKLNVAFLGEIRRLKDLPFSKIFSTSIGWSALLILPGFLSAPPLAPARSRLQAVWLAGAVFIQVLCRTVMTDFHDALGDRLFGRRTPVTILGWKRAGRMLTALLAFWALYLLAGRRQLGWPSPALPLLVFGPFYSAVTLRWVFKNMGLGGYRFDLLIDGQFLASGLAALLWANL